MIDDDGKTLLTQALARCESNGLGFTEIPLIYTHQIKELLRKVRDTEQFLKLRKIILMELNKMSVKIEVDDVVVEFLGYQVTYAEDYLYKGREKHVIYLADDFIYLKYENAEKRIKEIKKLEPSARLFEIEKKWRGN